MRSIAARTRRNVSAATESGAFNTRDTVIGATPANRATSVMRTLPVPRRRLFARDAPSVRSKIPTPLSECAHDGSAFRGICQTGNWDIAGADAAMAGIVSWDGEFAVRQGVRT